MNVLRLYAICDTRVNLFNAPFVCASDEECMLSLMKCLDSNPSLKENAKNYRCDLVGIFDQHNGFLTHDCVTYDIKHKFSIRLDKLLDPMSGEKEDADK